jgi:hypothetical protein
MLYQEFLNLTGRKISFEKYSTIIEPEYNESPLNKQEFCKQYIEKTARSKKQQEGNNYEIEIQRHNVTLAQFLHYVKTECTKKGIDFYIEKEEFENPSRPCNVYYFADKETGKKWYYQGNEKRLSWDDAPCQSEIVKIIPYETQTYILNFDNSMYNEICEFSFWDDKKGTGYYFQKNKQ